ncbi:MAG: hypothetical protein JNK61_08510 [Bacteroidia bacterium]|nr:hypothetical protein [Bacteroidia bacterium]
MKPALVKAPRPKPKAGTVVTPTPVVVEKSTTDLGKLLYKLRSKADKAPSLEELTEEVEAVRNKRYATKK